MCAIEKTLSSHKARLTEAVQAVGPLLHIVALTDISELRFFCLQGAISLNQERAVKTIKSKQRSLQSYLEENDFTHSPAMIAESFDSPTLADMKIALDRACA
jgi:hypothetical protein